MKKSTKIILPALAVLVLGTAAAATGTVAWFAANGVVDATGMHVQCEVSHNLIIANQNPKGSTNQETFVYGATAPTTNSDLATLAPASTTKAAITSGTPNFFTTAESTPIDANTGALLTGTQIIAATADVHYSEHDFWVANSADDDMNFFLSSITIEEELNEHISQALRIGVYYSTENNAADYGEIFNLGTASESYAGLNKAGYVHKSSTASAVKVTSTLADATKDDATATAASETVTPATSATNVSLGVITSTTEAVDTLGDYTWSAIKIFVWYEGQDADCTANDALDVQELHISVRFAANA